MTPPSAAARTLDFEATVTVATEVGGKKEQPVWLVSGDGQRRIVAYRPEPWFAAFDGHRVHVTASPWTPKGQALSGEHVRIETLELAASDPQPERARYTSLGPEQTLRGRFVEHTGAPGTKSEGERSTRFVAQDGTAYQLANVPEGVTTEVNTSIRVRTTTVSRFAAHEDGPTIWVLAVLPTARVADVPT
ncbi:MAG: hypothetical protein K1X88_05660 [Nannocystaceae bacterium]|nr:hypothetical protein [Nannocystaceae bacterium]